MSEDSVIAAYKLKLASNPEGQIDYETVEITHSLLSRRYLIVRGTSPLTATLETGEEVTFEPSPMVADNAANSNNLDQQAGFTLPDVGNLLDDEMQTIPLDNQEWPVFTYRRFINTDLSYPCDGPINYDLQSLSQSKGVFTADVGVPRLNERATGLLATPTDIPLLRGVLSS
jgi:hypothetical protein